MAKETQARQVLRDKTRSGKVRPWREKKLANLKYADYLEMLHFKKAHNVRECGDVLEFVADNEGRLKLARTWFCHSRLCPLCNWRRAMKNSNQLQRILREALQREKNGRFIFLTLTAKNATGETLKSALQAMGQAVYKLFQYKKVKKNLLGYVRSTEVTVNNGEAGDKPTYHYHMHVLLFVKASYFTGKQNYLSQAEWTKLWQRALKLDYTPIVHVEAVHANHKKGKSSLLASAQETAKYQVKSDDILTQDPQRDLRVIDDLEHGLAGSRQISYGGLLRQIRADLALDDAEDGNLVDTENPNDEVGEAVRRVVAKWDSINKNYFVLENQ